MPRPKLIAGNWKMYTSREEAVALADAVVDGIPEAAGAADNLEVALFPPYPWLIPVGEVVNDSIVSLGAQDCHYSNEGAFTGSVSPAMVLGAGCDYVIVGHSERRHGLGETDDLLNKKAKAAVAAGLHVIFCVGELLAERESGQTEAVLERQVRDGLAGVSAADLAKLVIAYEPVWAIGTGKVATPDQAQAAHAFIRRKFAGLFGENAAQRLLIQYGGSVKPDNAAGLLALPDVDGALVGGASLKADQFLAIVAAAK